MRHCAFTLIEVVVALALGVLLAAGVQSLTVHAFRTSAQLQREHTLAARRELAFILLEQDLATLPSPGVVLSAGGLQFTTAAALQSDRTVTRNAVDVRYVVEPDRSGRQRLLRIEREPGAASGPAGVELATALKTAQFAVFDGGDWLAVWPTGVPRAALGLRVRLEWPDGQALERRLALAPWHWRRHDE